MPRRGPVSVDCRASEARPPTASVRAWRSSRRAVWTPPRLPRPDTHIVSSSPVRTVGFGVFPGGVLCRRGPSPTAPARPRCAVSSARMRGGVGVGYETKYQITATLVVTVVAALCVGLARAAYMRYAPGAPTVEMPAAAEGVRVLTTGSCRWTSTSPRRRGRSSALPAPRAPAVGCATACSASRCSSVCRRCSTGPGRPAATWAGRTWYRSCRSPAPRAERPKLDYSWRSENGQWECPRGAENDSRQGRGRPVDGFGPCGRRISA